MDARVKPGHDAECVASLCHRRTATAAVYTNCPSLSGMSRMVAGANNSSSLTRRSVRPCSWVYCSSASMVGRFCSMP